MQLRNEVRVIPGLPDDEFLRDNLGTKVELELTKASVNGHVKRVGYAKGILRFDEKMSSKKENVYYLEQGKT